MNTNLWRLAVVLAAIMLGGAARADEEHTVLVCDGDSLPKVAVGDVVRITQSGPAGKTEITATVEGPAKLVSTRNVRRFANGQPVIGVTTKEFEIKAEKKGKAVIKVSLKDVVSKTTVDKQYDLVIE